MRVQVFIMSFYSNKDKMECNDYKDICRNHSTKADREVFRVCPSKLSKRELEDLYFNLLENNLELKKTINGQQDKIRVLSTQVQRMTNTQEKLVSREMKDRGTATKAVVDEQKDFITELKETNQRLEDRIQHLNMRLCSAKQFMKTTPPQTALSRGNRSSATAASTPKKHDCLSKAPESPEQVLKVSTYSQWEEKTPRKANQNQTTVPIEKGPVKSDQPCDENKCRTLMEELKLKIATLQDELINVHGEYATRIGRLETEVLEVRKENIRVVSERSASELELTDTFKKASDLLTQYRIFEAKCAELTTELAIERRKVAELETQLKAANMSDKVNKTIEDHLTTKQEASGAPDADRKGGSPRDGSPRKDGTRVGSLPVGGLRIGSPPIGGPAERSSRGGKPRNGGPDSGSKDGIPQDCISKDEILQDGIPKDKMPLDGIPKKDPQDGITKDGGHKKCKCGCPPPTPPTPPLSPPSPRNLPPPLAQVLDEKAPIKTLPPILPPKKRDGLDDTSAKSSPTKYSMKRSSSGSTYPTTTTTSEDTNCETCGCKFQLTSAVESHACSGQVHYYPITAATLNGKCSTCGYTPPQCTSTSTPIKDKKNDVECRCPAWVRDGSLKLSQDASPRCMKCCFKDELKSTGSSPPPRTDAGQPPSARATSEPGDPSGTNTGDDSGYQDTDEQGLLKQNRELMAQILDLQRQVDCMKIGGVCGMPGCSSENLSGFGQSPTKTADYSVVSSMPPLLEELPEASVLPEDKPNRPNSPDTKEYAPINSPPLLGGTPEAETPVEQIEQSLIDENYEYVKPIPSEDRVNQPRKILRIEVLGNPEKSCKAPPLDRQMSEDTRAKTVEDAYGTQYITDDSEPVPDKYGYPDLPNNSFKEHRWDSPKFEILEKKKRERSIAAVCKQDPENISPSATRLGFNPEKLKYLEAEGLTADMPELIKKESLESIPSNPELGFGIPRLASKASQERHKSETESGRPKKSLSTSICNVHQPAELRLAGRPQAARARPDDTTKDKEDCEFCAACSFDKECSHAIKPTMDKLALGIEMERAKKQDQHNSYQIPGPILSLDNVKKEKKKNLFSHFKKQKKQSLSGEDLVLDPKVYAKETSDTADAAVNIPDVPLLEMREKSATDYMLCKGSEAIQKPHDKKDKSTKRKQGSQTKEDLIVNSRVYAQQTCQTAGGPVEMADVPLLEKAVVESRAAGPGTADTKQKLPEKSSQAPCYTDSSWHSDVSPYRRRSGTYCFRRRPLSHEPPICRCAGQQDGSCSHMPKSRGTQAVDTQENVSPREKRRAAPTSDRGTYTLASKQTDTSPDNTDLEMSYLSDLPMEKEKKSPLRSRPLSPGEARTTTYSSTLSAHSPPTNYSLSEGEMPAPTSKRRHSEPDSDKLYLNAQLAHKLETPPSQQMEAALQAITDELQRCKNLLHRHRPAEVTPMSTVS